MCTLKILTFQLAQCLILRNIDFWIVCTGLYSEGIVSIHLDSPQFLSKCIFINALFKKFFLRSVFQTETR